MTSTKAKVILLFMVRNELHPLAEELLRRNVSLDITWLGPDGWIKDRVISSPRFFDLFQGAIGSSVNFSPIPGLHEYFRSLSMNFIAGYECENETSYPGRFNQVFMVLHLSCCYLLFDHVS